MQGLGKASSGFANTDRIRRVADVKDFDAVEVRNEGVVADDFDVQRTTVGGAVSNWDWLGWIAHVHNAQPATINGEECVIADHLQASNFCTGAVRSHYARIRWVRDINDVKVGTEDWVFYAHVCELSD